MGPELKEIRKMIDKENRMSTQGVQKGKRQKLQVQSGVVECRHKDSGCRLLLLLEAGRAMQGSRGQPAKEEEKREG